MHIELVHISYQEIGPLFPNFVYFIFCERWLPTTLYANVLVINDDNKKSNKY